MITDVNVSGTHLCSLLGWFTALQAAQAGTCLFVPQPPTWPGLVASTAAAVLGDRLVDTVAQTQPRTRREAQRRK